jgi:hypothetical protein
MQLSEHLNNYLPEDPEDADGRPLLDSSRSPQQPPPPEGGVRLDLTRKEAHQLGAVLGSLAPGELDRVHELLPPFPREWNFNSRSWRLTRR